jgi:hypothetical protein
LYIDEHVLFNRWFRENAARTIPTIDLLDTTGVPIPDTVKQVAAWIGRKREAEAL